MLDVSGEWKERFNVKNAHTLNRCLLYIYTSAKIGALRAPHFFYWTAPSEDRTTVSTETVTLVTASNGKIAAFVPDSLERYWKRGRRKMRCGRRDASATSIYSFCCCRRSRRNRWLRQQIRTENLGNNDSTFFVYDGSPGVE